MRGNVMQVERIQRMVQRAGRMVLGHELRFSKSIFLNLKT